MDGDDNDFDGRDRRGRWVKGHCPNRNGRPRKKPVISDADVGYFKQQMVEATVKGEKCWLTRHELLLHSMFDQALKGKVSMARKLFDRLESVETLWAEAQALLKRLAQQLLENYDETGKFDDKLLDEYETLRRGLTYDRAPQPERAPRRKAYAEPPTWRTRPKPQAVLDLERQWAEEEAEEKARAAARSKTKAKAGST
jgi:hypothetical protein